MDIKLFKALANDYTKYNLGEIEEIEIMTLDEVNSLLTEMERETGNHSDWDVIRVIFTCKYYMDLKKRR